MATLLSDVQPNDIRRHYKPEVRTEMRKTALRFYARSLLRRLVEEVSRDSTLSTHGQTMRMLRQPVPPHDPQRIKAALYPKE